jgi:enoyl-CoA hydratase/carnithine racemase
MAAISERKRETEFGFKEILYDKRNMVARITINRPQVYNAYSTTTLKEIAQAFDEVSDDDSVGVAVFTGAGDKAFCTGGDVKEYATVYQKSPHRYWNYMVTFDKAVTSIRCCRVPVIARVNGIAAGGGNELHQACDLSIASENAKFMQVGVRVGSVAAGGATQWLPILIGDRRARWMLYTTDEVDAVTAEQWGLVNKVVPYSQLDEAVEEVANKILSKFPECLRYTKAQVNFWKDLAWNNTIQHARDWLALHMGSAEAMEGMRAFVEKRPADYIGIRRILANGESPELPWGQPTTTCPKCGAKNLPQRFKFCGSCGSKL